MPKINKKMDGPLKQKDYKLAQEIIKYEYGREHI